MVLGLLHVGWIKIPRAREGAGGVVLRDLGSCGVAVRVVPGGFLWESFIGVLPGSALSAAPNATGQQWGSRGLPVGSLWELPWDGIFLGTAAAFPSSSNGVPWDSNGVSMGKPMGF